MASDIDLDEKQLTEFTAAHLKFLILQTDFVDSKLSVSNLNPSVNLSDLWYMILASFRSIFMLQ